MSFLFYLILATAGYWTTPHTIDGYYIDLPNAEIINTAKIDITMDDLKLTKNPERFDRTRHDQLKDELGNSKYLLSDGTVVKNIESKSDIWHGLIPKDSYFELIKIYYPSGVIQSKGWAYVNSFAAGIWYEFDESGELTKEVNYDAPFKFTFKDILAFCKKNHIEVTKGQIPESSGLYTSIFRDVTDGKSWWEIEYSPSGNGVGFGATMVYIKLDGNTGKVTSRYQYVIHE